jgi:adenosine deaminase
MVFEMEISNSGLNPLISREGNSLPLGGQGSFEELLTRAPELNALSDDVLRAFISRLPGIDLHRHLEGAIEPEVLLKLSRKYGFSLPAADVESLRPHVQVTSEDRTLLDFLKKFEPIGNIFVSRQLIRDLTFYSIQEAARDNVAYLELRFSPIYMASAHKLDVEDVMKGVLSGTRTASRKLDTRVNLILIVERQMGLDSAWAVERLAEKYKDRGVVALDLANDEFNYPPGPYAPVFQAARGAGLNVTVHAGEAGGPENIRVSVEQLKAQRIGHGVRAYQDNTVEELLRDAQIPLEMCITSNAQTGAIDRIENHPLKKYDDQRIIVTINTDDPGVSGIRLSDEYQRAVRLFSLSARDLHRIILNAVDSAFIPESEKIVLAERVTRGFQDAIVWLCNTAH